MDLLVGDLLSVAAANDPHAIAATLGDREVTFAELDASADRLTAAMVAAGIGRGEIVAWWSPPSLTSIAGFAAAARAGAVFAPLNPAFNEAEVGAALDYLRPRLLVAGSALAELASSVFGGDMAVIDTDQPAPLPRLESLSPPSGTVPTPVKVDGSDPHIVYLTSGTTGAPKGVVVSHRASWLRAFPGGSTFADGLRGDGGILPAFPLFHYGGWHYVLESWHHRCAFHACDRFDGATLASVASRRTPAAMYCIPAVWERVLESATRADLSSVLHADTGTSAAPPELLQRIKARLPQATTSVLYGSTEGGHHSTLLDREIEDHPGSVGRAAPPGVIRVDAGGEILYRSPTVMTGYLDRPDETEAALRDGWYHTGDLGTVDERGYLYITGRAREVIRTGGETVSPAEVEAALQGCPGIADIAVVGVEDGAWGEIVTAAVVCSPSHSAPTVQDLRRHIGDKLASFKHPRSVVAVGRIPRTPATGQVQRTLLRQELAGSREPAQGSVP